MHFVELIIQKSDIHYSFMIIRADHFTKNPESYFTMSTDIRQGTDYTDARKLTTCEISSSYTIDFVTLCS